MTRSPSPGHLTGERKVGSATTTLLDTLPEGTSVKIEVVGTALAWPGLIGHVSGIVATAPVDGATQARTARVVLTPESAVALKAMEARSGFIRAIKKARLDGQP